MRDDGQRTEQIAYVALHLREQCGMVDAQALQNACEQNGIHITLEEAQVTAEETNRCQASCVGTIGGMSRVCPCGEYRVWLRQAKTWACPKCQRSISSEPSDN